jgi:hypothetical protein
VKKRALKRENANHESQKPILSLTHKALPNQLLVTSSRSSPKLPHVTLRASSPVPKCPQNRDFSTQNETSGSFSRRNDTSVKRLRKSPSAAAQYRWDIWDIFETEMSRRCPTDVPSVRRKARKRNPRATRLAPASQEEKTGMSVTRI